VQGRMLLGLRLVQIGRRFFLLRLSPVLLHLEVRQPNPGGDHPVSRMTTTLPGFHAEASLYHATGHYQSTGASIGSGGGVVPQFDQAFDLQAAPSTCYRVCRCCRNSGNRFCCSHCRWCSGPIGTTTYQAFV
jgi:hypothetical protein